jgi:signal peptidase II
LIQVVELLASAWELTTSPALSAMRVESTAIVLREFGISRNLAPQTSENEPENSVSALRKSCRPSPVRLGGVKSGRVICYLVALLTLLADMATKSWAVSALSDGQPREVLGPLLKFHYARNPGAAFSFATGSTWIFTLVATVVALVVIFVAGRIASRRWALALGLLLGGSLGNLSHRVFRSPGHLRGLVVDWIELPHWPIFNIADSAIVVAAAVITILSARGVGYRDQVASATDTKEVSEPS